MYKTWLQKIHARQQYRTFRDWGLPDIVVNALETIADVYAELRAIDAVEPLSERYPRGSPMPRDFIRSMPPYWDVGFHGSVLDDLEIAFHSDAERLAAEAARAERVRASREALALYDKAKDAYAAIAPILMADEWLRITLHQCVWEGRDILDPECLRALIAFRKTLAEYVAGRAPQLAVAAYLLKLDQSIDRIRDELRRIVLRRLAEGTIVGAERREFIALLEADAANGTWPDPEADISAVERAVAPRQCRAST
jgi:hypothetical protein